MSQRALRDDRDAEAVARVLGGDVEAFGELVERYREAFGRYATAVCGDADLAGDAMQEAFIRAFQGLARCREPGRFGTWFFRILTNQCRNHRARWRRGDSSGLLEAAAAEATDQAALRDETRRAVARALTALPPGQRESFVLRHVEGRSYHEIAGLLGEREDVVRKRVQRARERLQALLGGLA